MTQQIDLFEALLPGELAINERVTFADGARTLHEWVVTVGAFHAVIPECRCGLVRTLGTVYRRDDPNVIERVMTAPLTNCLCRSDACRRKPVERSGVCHGWHRPRVDRFVAEITTSIRKGGR